MAIAEAGARQRVTITDNVILDFTGLFREAEKREQASDSKENTESHTSPRNQNQSLEE